MRKKIVNFSLILFLIFSYISTSFASTTESDNGIMKYYLNKYHVMDIKGYVNNKLHSTTFADGGYITYVKINDGNKKVLLDGRKIEDIEWNSSCNFVNDGNFVQLVYNVKNTSQKNMKLSVSGCVDVQISENDYATIERLPNDMGLKLCDDKNNIQFEFYGKNVMGTSDIDKLWIGEYYSNAGDDNDTDNSDDEDDEDDDTDISDDFDNKSYVMVRSVQSFADSVRDVLEKGLNPAGRSDYKMIDLTYELSDYAQKNQMCRRMYGSLEPDSMRSEYQRDRERIVNSKAFRRLVDKAQIFSAEKGDHYRTRMTHTLEVNQIAKAISMGLRLNLDLTEAIALAHDMGHTPFGHQGERTIRDILKGDKCVNLFNIKEEYYEKLGGFKHNYQGIRVLTKLEEKYAEHLGLDVCFQVLEGVLKHTKLKDAQIEEFINEKFIEELHINMDFCTNLEGQVVAIADEIAQRGHDIDDAINSGLLNVDELLDSLAANKFKSLNEMLKKEIDNVKKRQRHYISEKELVIGRIISCIVGYFINDVIENSKNELNRYSKDYSEGIFDEKLIAFSKPGKNCCDFLEKLINKRVIADSEVTRFDYNAEIIISKLFESYYKNPKLLHAGTLRKIYVDTMLHENAEVANSAIDLLNGNVDITRLEIEEITKKSIDDITNIEQEVIFEKRKILIRNIADYLAGMTDSYAMNEYQKIR